MSDRKLPTTPPVHTTAADVRPRGRPVGTTRITEPRQSTGVWLPASLHDMVIRYSGDNEQSVSETIRQAVRQLLILKL